MLNLSKKLILTTRLAFLSILLLIFMSCQQLFLNSNNSKSTVSFSISTPRAALSLTEGEKLFIDLALDGEYKASKTAEITIAEALQFTFEGVPVGKQVLASAEIYMMYDEVKLVLYAGESEKKAVIDGENPFTLPMQVAYNSIAKGTSSCLIMRPLFTSEATNEALKSNRLDFNSESETFSFKVNTSIEEDTLVLDEYQKAIITIKGAGEGEHTIRTKFVKSTTAAMYYQDPVTISTESKPYEMLIPQGIKLDSIGFENSRNDDSNSWTSDYSFVIEKIELFKDSSLIDPEFNVVTKTASTYTVKNPAVQIIANTAIDKNKITFKPTDADNYSAAYWEFPDLSDYDKVYITYSGGVEKEFLVNGFLPADYSRGIEQKHSSDVIEDSGAVLNKITIANNPETKEIQISSILKNNLTSDELQAIEFKFNGSDVWSLEIKEIRLEKIGSFNISVAVVESESDIHVDEEDVNTGDIVGKKFTAPAGYTSYVWKVNGNVQEESGNEFTFNMKDLDNQVYDVILLADSETEHHSWQAHITKS